MPILSVCRKPILPKRQTMKLPGGTSAGITTQAGCAERGFRVTDSIQQRSRPVHQCFLLAGSRSNQRDRPRRCPAVLQWGCLHIRVLQKDTSESLIPHNSALALTFSTFCLQEAGPAKETDLEAARRYFSRDNYTDWLCRKGLESYRYDLTVLMP